jgi:hypothetical protein
MCRFVRCGAQGLLALVRSAEGSLVHPSLLVSRFDAKPLDARTSSSSRVDLHRVDCSRSLLCIGAEKTQFVTSHIQSVLGGAHIDYAPLFTARNEQAILSLATLIINTQIRDRRRILVEIPWWAFWV